MDQVGPLCSACFCEVEAALGQDVVFLRGGAASSLLVYSLPGIEEKQTGKPVIKWEQKLPEIANSTEVVKEPAFLEFSLNRNLVIIF